MQVPVQGFMYPNEVELQWSILIVLYPYITGLVAGAFILASLERVFRVEAVKPTYRLALLTALAFLLVAPLPLQLHLGHPERSFEMYMTPHRSSAMAMFGFVYLWYLMAVLLLEIWLDYRRDIVVLSKTETGWKRQVYRLLTLGSSNISKRSLRIDDRLGYFITLIGIPSAFLLHGYVGFIDSLQQVEHLQAEVDDEGVEQVTCDRVEATHIDPLPAHPRRKHIKQHHRGDARNHGREQEHDGHQRRRPPGICLHRTEDEADVSMQQEGRRNAD